MTPELALGICGVLASVGTYILGRRTTRRERKEDRLAQEARDRRDQIEKAAIERRE